MATFLENDSIVFSVKEYKFKKWLTPGGTGDTMLMYDEIIDQYFVCKKFAPKQIEYQDKLFSSFIDEIKILYNSQHKNVVRIYSHFTYPNMMLGYIVMEYVEGQDIESFLSANPNSINDVFLQTIEGFSYLESIGILHRDIRNTNILVTSKDSTVKIIDFGFSKIIESNDDYKTSLLLNWTENELPTEIYENSYTSATDIYFLGRLFQKIIDNTQNPYFKFGEILNDMTQKQIAKREANFNSIRQKVIAGSIFSISDNEKEVYSNLANLLTESISKINEKPVFVFDDEKVLRNLIDLIKRAQWENVIKNIPSFVNCFFEQIEAEYSTSVYDEYGNYVDELIIRIPIINEFIDMFMNFNKEKRINILENLYYNRIVTLIKVPPWNVQNTDFDDIDDDSDLPF